MKVKLKGDYHSITPGKEYRLTPGVIYTVIGIECDDYRIISDRNDPVLYSPRLFDIIDSSEPSDWVCTIDDGCRYAYPAELSEAGFWEDYHDGVAKAVDVFNGYVLKLARKDHG